MGEVNSNVQSISLSTIVLLENDTFILTDSRTSLEFVTPSTSVTQIKGTYSKSKSKIKLTAIKSRLSYTFHKKNQQDYKRIVEKKENGPKYKPSDPEFGEWMLIEDSEKDVEFNYFIYPNSVYFINDNECYIQYLEVNLEKAKDMKNYCSEIIKSYAQ